MKYARVLLVAFLLQVGCDKAAKDDEIATHDPFFSDSHESSASADSHRKKEVLVTDVKAKRESNSSKAVSLHPPQVEALINYVREISEGDFSQFFGRSRDYKLKEDRVRANSPSFLLDEKIDELKQKWIADFNNDIGKVTTIGDSPKYYDFNLHRRIDSHRILLDLVYEPDAKPRIEVLETTRGEGYLMCFFNVIYRDAEHAPNNQGYGQPIESIMLSVRIRESSRPGFLLFDNLEFIEGEVLRFAAPEITKSELEDTLERLFFERYNLEVKIARAFHLQSVGFRANRFGEFMSVYEKALGSAGIKQGGRRIIEQPSIYQINPRDWLFTPILPNSWSRYFLRNDSGFNGSNASFVYRFGTDIDVSVSSFEQRGNELTAAYDFNWKVSPEINGVIDIILAVGNNFTDDNYRFEKELLINSAEIRKWKRERDQNWGGSGAMDFVWNAKSGWGIKKGRH